MKLFALAATVVAGLLFTASSADAQYRRSRGAVYVSPSYGVPVYNGVYSYNSGVYAPPVYNGVVGVGSYTPLGGTSIIVPSGGIPSYGSPSYDTPTYNNSYYTTPYYNFNGSSVVPYSSTRPGWRW